ncbi:MAG: NADP oxidoreductase [Anaerolineales bacterium]|nr:NADP oxidoreductase [Anaerolineae bacterium]PWB51438.1 MAG: NADP oxidoreductase [Anaerolineales bacterium]
MDVTMIGTGKMARGISTRLLVGGHQITLVGHTAGKAESLAAELGAIGKGRIEVAHAGVLGGEVVFLAVPYAAAQSVVAKYRERLKGKVLVDITNPMNFQTLEPTSPDNISGAEGLAKLLPDTTQVIKAFNTVFSRTLPEGQKAGQVLDVFIAGDDAEEKAKVSRLIESGGMRLIDTGPLKRARQLEASGLLHVALQSQVNGGYSTAFKLII